VAFLREKFLLATGLKTIFEIVPVPEHPVIKARSEITAQTDVSKH